MVEIIPNWHPAFVHFPIALLLTAIGALWISVFLPPAHVLTRQMQTFAHWNLRVGFVFAIFTAWLGWLAYTGVEHNQIAVQAMNMHRGWAIVTVSSFIPFFIVSWFRHRLSRPAMLVFVAALFIPASLLIRTGWLGGEVVYRYGVGVQRPANIEQTQDPEGGTDSRDEGPLSRSGDIRYPDPDYDPEGVKKEQ